MIRVVLAEMPRMLRDLLEGMLARQADIVVVGAASTRDALEPTLHRTHADVVLLAMPSDDQAAEYAQLLYAFPRTTLLAITHDGRGAFLYALRPHKVPIGDVSPDGIVSAIHEAYRLAV